MDHARKERVLLFGTDQRITSGPAARRPHSKAEYMTAPERFADSQIPLAPRAPSIHDPRDLMRPFPAGLMRMWPISTRVNKPENDDPSIVEPIELATDAA